MCRWMSISCIESEEFLRAREGFIKTSCHILPSCHLFLVWLCIQSKTVRNTFFLILYEMGKEDKDVRHIMGISQEAIRSTRFRIQKRVDNSEG